MSTPTFDTGPLASRPVLAPLEDPARQPIIELRRRHALGAAVLGLAIGLALVAVAAGLGLLVASALYGYGGLR